MRTVALAALFLLAGCVSSEQYRTLTASYDAYYTQTAEVYLKAVDADSTLAPSVKASKRHDVEQAGVTVQAAKGVK